MLYENRALSSDELGKGGMLCAQSLVSHRMLAQLRLREVLKYKIPASLCRCFQDLIDIGPFLFCTEHLGVFLRISVSYNVIQAS